MRVLIIGDDPPVRAGCMKVLERRGFACTAVENGARALECVRRASFDAALIDLKTPGTSGMELLKKLRDESPNTAVIIISGCPSTDSAVEAVKAGAFDYLPKPFNPEVLAERVRRAVHAVRKALAESLIQMELERKKFDNPANVPPAAMGRVARLIHGRPADAQTEPDGADDLPETLDQIEAEAIRNAIRRFQGNKTRAAERLGINRKTLREKMRKYDIRVR